MPTLNLGRVRFNWKGAYDALTPYLVYDCIEDDGQSYTCIAAITGTSPADSGGATYWSPMLVRSADYNQARADAIAAATAAGDSATDASGSANTASGAATAASGSESAARKWASELEDVAVETGKYSAFHYMQKAAAFGDPNQFNITADQTADTRTTAAWMAALLVAQQKAGDNATAINNNATAINNNATAMFVKGDGAQPAWTMPTTSTLQTASIITVAVGLNAVQVASGAIIALPALLPGTDYFIYLASDGSLQAAGADVAPPAAERLVGGFHVRDGDGEINPRSLWDLNWRPQAGPRGMALSIDGRVWGDIYLMDTQYGVNGYSRNGVTIADGGSLPVKPSIYGGNGTDAYTSMSWWVAVDLATAAGKRLPFYQEFTAMAYGVVERQAVGTDPVTTQHQAGHRSACGCEQITGVLNQWGADISGTSATGTSSWQNIAEGRGDVYTNSIRSPLFGANWYDGSNAGSRASNWSSSPDGSGSDVGARGVSDHLNLQAER